MIQQFQLRNFLRKSADRQPGHLSCSREGAIESLAREVSCSYDWARDISQLLIGSEKREATKLILDPQAYIDAEGNPEPSYQAMRWLYFRTRNEANLIMKRHLASAFSVQALPSRVNSIMGLFRKQDIEDIARQIRIDGYYQFHQKIPSDTIFSLTNTMDGIAANDSGSGYSKCDAERIQYHETTLLNSGMGKIAADPLFYHIASQYLETQPVLSLVSAWTSMPHGNEYQTLSNHAQMFHVDMSHPNFLKVFIYLNDVSMNNGPHCLVPGTHLQKAIWRDGRIDDSEMSGMYDKDCWKYQVGGEGSVFIVDTKAFHKGMAVQEGSRRLAQFYYTDSQFGEKVRVQGPSAPKLSAEVFGDPSSYGARFLQRYALELPI